MHDVESVKRLLKGDARTANVAKNILASFALKGVSIIVSFLLVPLTIGYVSSELYGVWLTLSSVLTWLCFLDVGFSQGLKNKLAEAVAVGDFRKGKSLVSTTYFMMLIIVIPVCIVLQVIIPLVDWCTLLNIDMQYQEEIKLVMGVLIAFACLQMVVNVIVSVVAAFQQVALSNSLNVIGSVLSLIVIYIQTKTCPPSLLSLSLSLAAVPIVVFVLATILLFSTKFKSIVPSVNSIKLGYVKDLFSLGYKFFIINIQVVVLYQSTNVLISNVSSPIDVTNYNVAYRLLNVAMMAYTIILTPLWPAYTDAYTKGDFLWMEKTFNRMRKVLLISILGCFVITLASPFIYKIWLGNSVEVPFAMTLLVAIYVSVYCWMNLNGTLAIGMGKVKVSSCMVLVGMVLHIPLSLFFSSYMGAYGVLLSLILINTFYAVVTKTQVHKILNKTATGIWLQ